MLRAAGVTLPVEPRWVEFYPGFTIGIVAVESGYQAVDLWNAVLAVHNRLGWWPVLTSSATWRGTPLDRAERGRSPTAGDGAGWLAERAREAQAEPDGFAIKRGAYSDIDRDGFDADDMLAMLAEQLTELTLVPAAAGWQVPGLLAWDGAGNYDRHGDEHATMLRRWAGHHGVELVGLSDDVMTLRIGHPPTSAVDALDFAVEAYWYCPDSVEQGLETVDALAELLMGPACSFWWD